MSSGDSQVKKAIAWVGMASGVVAVLDACTLAILLWGWVTPTEFGIASLAQTLFLFLDLLTDAGVTSVIVQRGKLDERALSTAFWLNTMITTAGFVLMLGIGPLIGYIQGHEIVGWMLIAYATKLLYQNIYFIPAALLRREMRFKELSVVRTIANAAEMAAKIGFAAAGEPIWCFVAGPLTRVFVTGIGLQIARPWRPTRVFDRAEARGMVAYGLNTTGSQYLQHFYSNVSHQVVGFFFGSTALGAYRIAYELVLYPINWVASVVATVAFPALARLREAPAELAAQFLQFSRQNLAVAMPLLVLLVAGAPEILALAFPSIGEVALPVRLLCIVGLLRAIDCLYLPLLDALGYAGRNFAVAGLAAAVLTTCDIAFAALLGPHLAIDYTAVALGRIIGYPIVISVHAAVALGRTELTIRTYVMHLASIVACGIVAVLPGFLIAELLPTSSPALRLLVIGGTSLLTLEVLLGAFHGLGLRAVLKGLRRKAP